MGREDDIRYLAEAMSEDRYFETHHGDVECVFCYSPKGDSHDNLCPIHAARRIIKK